MRPRNHFNNTDVRRTTIPHEIKIKGLKLLAEQNNTKGNRRFYKDNKISMPFYRAQLYTAERGYKLIDCTDTDIKKWSTFIVIATKDKTTPKTFNLHR